ncbi:MAG: sugar ABC transporter substrate-binding protein [Chloroflexi bacterium]|nr:MAG: sugar ABC transporter substrate-binding protein [Chloroflexota bacterium]
MTSTRLGVSAKRSLFLVCAGGLATVAMACSGGGAPSQATQAPAAAGAQAPPAATTPRLKVAMITHQAPGDTFRDIVRKGAIAAADKDNIELIYSNDPEAAKQSTLVQNAIDSKVNGIAITLSKPDALAGAVQNATNAKIPVVAFNSGLDAWSQTGAMMYFGQDENLAGQTAGQRLTQEGLKHTLCVVQEQGHVALEARCAGVKQGLSGGQTENLYVTGTNMPSVKSTIAAKLQSDSSIDSVITLGAPFALTAVQSVKDASSKAKVYTFDTNAELVNAVKSGDVQWAIDQQPYLQGYLAVDSLWLYLNNGDTIGGGKTVLTGPSFITKDNIEAIAQYASKGTR